MYSENHENPEKQSFREISGEEKQEILDEIYNELEQVVIDEYNEKFPPLSKEERKLETVRTEGEAPTVIERIRERPPQEGEFIPGKDSSWVVLDFDDVINHTTEFNLDLRAQLVNISGLTEEEIASCYNKSKMENEEGKMVHDHEVYIDQIVEQADADKEEDIREFVHSFDYGAYVDAAVRRSVMAIRAQTQKWQRVRISILTFGNIDYQKMRVDMTDMDELVDDIIYTEGSKRDVVDTLIDTEYVDEGKGIPFIITFDDSATHLEDYHDLDLKSRYMNVHFNHPQAKRYQKRAKSGQVIVSSEEGGERGSGRNYTYWLVNHCLRICRRIEIVSIK